MEHTVKVYACGGASINIMKSLYYPSKNNIKDPGFAKLEIVFMDTSRSNIPKDVDDEDFYLVQGLGDEKIDGSGKVRATNYKAVSLAIPEILHRFKPAELNIVIHSASGGSGGVLGASLVSELLNQDKAVIVVMIGSTTCEQEIRNTINTILSYQAISAKRDKSVVALYLENGNGVTMSENDALVRINTLLLTVIWSGENHGLDSKDLDNFLNYQRVSKYQPALTGLTIQAGKIKPKLEKGQAVSSVISLIREGEDPDPGMIVGYHSFGTISEAAYVESVKMPTPIHLHTVQGYFSDIITRLQTKLSEAEEQYRVNPINVLKLNDVDIQDDGLVF